MQALVWQGPSNLQAMDIPEPSPAEGEVIVRVSAVGICGSELEGYLGYSSIRKPPLVMGHEFSAFVTHDGSRERRFPVGTLVTVNPLMTCRRCRACKRGATNLCIHRKLIGVSRQGGMAEYVAVPEENVHVLPEGVSALQGSLSEPLAVAVRAVELSRFALLDRVAIIGAGSIGLLTLQVIRSLGPADIAVIDIADERLATASALGATTTLNTKPRQSEPKDFVEHEHSYDIVLECVGRDETRALASRLAAPGGRIVLVGLHDQHSSMDFNAIVRHELQVLGSYVYSDANFSTAIEFLRLGRIATEPWIIERPLQEGPRSFQELTTGAGMNHKVVLLPKS